MGQWVALGADFMKNTQIWQAHQQYNILMPVFHIFSISMLYNDQMLCKTSAYKVGNDEQSCQITEINVDHLWKPNLPNVTATASNTYII